MNNYYTLHSQVAELRYKISGKEISRVITQRKDQLEFYFLPDGSGKLVFSVDPACTAFFFDPRSDFLAKPFASLFSEINGALIADMSMVCEHDRLVSICFEARSHELLFQPFGSRPNLFLTTNGYIHSAFKHSESCKGQKAPVPGRPARKPDTIHTAKSISSTVETCRKTDIQTPEIKERIESIKINEPLRNKKRFLKDKKDAETDEVNSSEAEGAKFSPGEVNSSEAEDVKYTPGEVNSSEAEDVNFAPGSAEKALESDPASIRKEILSYDPQFPRGLIDDLVRGGLFHAARQGRFHVVMERLKMELLNPGPVSITAAGKLCLLRSDYLPEPPREIHDSVNDAVRRLFLEKNRLKRLAPLKSELLKRMEKKQQSLNRQYDQLLKAGQVLERADRIEYFAHLLMAHPRAGYSVSENSIEVEDWNRPGHFIDIPVEPGNTPVEQAQRYYQKVSRLRMEASHSAKRMKQMAVQLSDLQEKRKELENMEHFPELEKWISRQMPFLGKLGIQVPGRPSISRPFRHLQLESFEIWIGKSGKSNDEILARSHKEDIWMHVRGAAGSHLVIRCEGRTGWPPATVLQKAAQWTAAFSKLSGSSMVPVMMAKRKHVRKPKGTGPGQVVVIREKVEMVRPEKPSDYGM